MDLDRAFTEGLSRVARQWRSRVDAALRAVGMTSARGRTLYQLVNRAGSMTQTELAQVLEIEGPTLVRLLDGLEQQQLIERHADGADRRAKRIRATPAGEARAREVMAIVERITAHLLDGVSPAEIEIMVRLFHLMSSRLGPEEE